MTNTPLKARTVSVSIGRSPADVYRFVADPRNLPRWAAGLARAVRKSGDAWTVDTPGGPMGIRFAPENDLGVLDHYVSLPAGGEVYVPLRVIANGAGSEVLFTLFRLAEMSDAKYAEDLGMVLADLESLKALLEGDAR